MVPIDEQIACVERELRMRKRVYPGRIYAGKMSQLQANQEIGAMEAVLRTLRAEQAKERLL